MAENSEHDDHATMSQLECKKCGHVWTPIVEEPLKCPYCNQPKYWLPKVRNGEGNGEQVEEEIVVPKE